MAEQITEQKIHLAKTSASQFITVYTSKEVYRGSEVLANRESFTGLRLHENEFAVTVNAGAVPDWLTSSFGFLQNTYAAEFWKSRNWEINESLAPVTMISVGHHGSHYAISTVGDFPSYSRILAKHLAADHPLISAREDVLSGTPHIDGTRISVANVLAEIYYQGSIDAVSKKFKRIVNVEQIKAAIAYAHDFMERACDLPEDDD